MDPAVAKGRQDLDVDLPAEDHLREFECFVVRNAAALDHGLLDVNGIYLDPKDAATKIDRLNTAGVPCGKVLSVGEVFEDPQIKSQDMVLDVDHGRGARHRGLEGGGAGTGGGAALRPPADGRPAAFRRRARPRL